MEETVLNFKEWLATRPKHIQKLAKKYPPGEYKIKKGAPYGVSCANTVVLLHGYNDSGEVSVIVPSEHKLPKAIKFEKELGERYGKTPEEIKQIHESSILVLIDPKWMKLIKRFEGKDSKNE